MEQYEVDLYNNVLRALFIKYQNRNLDEYSYDDRKTLNIIMKRYKEHYDNAIQEIEQWYPIVSFLADEKNLFGDRVESLFLKG